MCKQVLQLERFACRTCVRGLVDLGDVVDCASPWACALTYVEEPGSDPDYRPMMSTRAASYRATVMGNTPVSCGDPCPRACLSLARPSAS
jgi:hypothetical protein